MKDNISPINKDREVKPGWGHLSYDQIFEAEEQTYSFLEKLDMLGVEIDFERLNGIDFIALLKTHQENNRNQILKIQVPIRPESAHESHLLPSKRNNRRS